MRTWRKTNAEPWPHGNIKLAHIQDPSFMAMRDKRQTVIFKLDVKLVNYKYMSC